MSDGQNRWVQSHTGESDRQTLKIYCQDGRTHGHTFESYCQTCLVD